MNLMQNKARNAIWALALTIFLSGCASNYGWGWFVVNPSTAQGRNNLDFLIGGLGNTIAVSLCAMFLSVSIGLAIGVMGMTKSKLLRGTSRVYVEAFRSVPILVMLLWVFYGLPVLIGLRLDVFSAAVLALALCDSAFEAEIFRGGIQSIERGQHEAADSIGLTWWHKMRLIILPQAIRRILPPLGNQFVYVTKMSSLASVIGLGELTRQANELVVTLYRPLEIYTILVLEYMALILVISWGVRWLEAKLGSDESKSRR